ERLVDRRGGLLDRAGGGVRLRQPVEIETVGDPLAGGEIHAKPFAELRDALVGPAVLGEGGPANDRAQAREQRESMLGREGDQRPRVFAREPWLPEKDVERAREEARPGDGERISQLLGQLERLPALPA